MRWNGSAGAPWRDVPDSDHRTRRRRDVRRRDAGSAASNGCATGKISPAARIETALGNFFRAENLAALRELAVREMMRARRQRRRARPFARIVLGVAPRERDVGLITRAGRLARRLDVDLAVVCFTPPDMPIAAIAADALARATSAAGGAFVFDAAPNAAERVAQTLTEGDVLAVESPRRRRTPFGKRSFAVRVLAAGARELLVLAPREADTQSAPV